MDKADISDKIVLDKSVFNERIFIGTWQQQKRKQVVD